MNTLQNTEEKKYQPIMIKKDLKDILDKQIILIGKKMSYSQLIHHLVDSYNQKNS